MNSFFNTNERLNYKIPSTEVNSLVQRVCFERLEVALTEVESFIDERLKVEETDSSLMSVDEL